MRIPPRGRAGWPAPPRLASAACRAATHVRSRLAGPRKPRPEGKNAMDFAYTEKVEQLRARLLAFFDEHIYPNEHLHHHQIAAAPDRWQPVPIIEELKPKARAAGLWNLFLPESRPRRRADQPGIRAAGRDHGPRALVVARCSTAPRPIPATWRSRALRHRGAEGALAGAAAGRRDPLLLRMTEPDVASSDATNIQTPHRARRRRLRDQRPQVVVDRRRRSALRHLHRHGQDRTRTTRTSTSSNR